MKASEFLLKMLQKQGISHLFLVPGGYVDPFISALGKVAVINGIVATHEGGAVFMADGYARASGKFGVAMGIGGPGITNMITGIATAYTDEIPLFIVTGETKISIEGRGAFQDSSTGGIDDTVILQPITVKKLNVVDVGSLNFDVKQLLHAMLNHAKRGPVQLSVPVDIQEQEGNFQCEKIQDSFYHPRLLDKQNVADLWPLLNRQSRIVILAGTGTLHSGASNALVEIADRFNLPIATTLEAKGVMPEDHRLSLGVFGWFGSRRANEVLLSKQIDVLIVLGSKLSQMGTMSFTKDLLPRHALIINDLSESNWYANYEPKLFILGDNNEFLQTLLNADKKQQQILLETASARKKWIEKYVLKIPHYYDEDNLKNDIIPIHPARVIHELQRAMPANTMLFVGEGAHGFFAAHYWISLKPRQFFTTVKYMSPMGWSVAAAIGGKLARPDQVAVCLTGDGSIMMHGMEIQTAARYNIPVIFIVFNNKSHGNPQLRGRRVGKFECNFLSLPQHDWAKFGEALGAVGMTVTKPEELFSTFEQALQLKKTVIIDVITGNYPTPTYLFDEYMYGIKSPIKRL